MKRSLNTREKRLLTFCLLTLLIVGNALALREFLSRRKTASALITSLKGQEASNRIWLGDRPLYEKRSAWLDKSMPYTASAGKSRGELLDDLRGSALDLGLKTENESPLDSVALELDNKDVYANEVSVSMRVRGDQDTLLRWLLTLQSPERFTIVKALELELDSRSKEKTPQAQCNLTVARWFNPNPPPGTVPETPPEAAPAATTPPVAAPTDETPNPLELGSPLDGIVPKQSS
jgi:hypothetical protein